MIKKVYVLFFVQRVIQINIIMNILIENIEKLNLVKMILFIMRELKKLKIRFIQMVEG